MHVQSLQPPVPRVEPTEPRPTAHRVVQPSLGDPAVDELCRLLARIVLRQAAAEPISAPERVA